MSPSSEPVLALIRCTECKQPEGAPHAATCHRHGPVSIAADYRFAGRAMATIQELTADNARLCIEIERLKGELSSFEGSPNREPVP